jgi:hypothetical protein
MGYRTKLLAALGTVAAMLLLAAPAAARDVYVGYYEPQFYIDRLVFFDEDGRPYYYLDDQAYRVPEDYPFYDELVDHYWNHVDAYLRWFEQVGYASLHYRRPLRTDYYEPLFYQEYPVFFRDDGRPYYYMDGRIVLVPAGEPAYRRLMRHYRRHRAAYHRWYRQRGRHYRWYRRPIATSYYHPLYHDGYLLFFDAAGLPFFYRGGRKVHIDRGHRRFSLYVDHHRRHRRHYDRWYRESGRRHHGYRQPRGYRSRVRYDRAPRGRRGRIEDRSRHRRNRRRDRPVLRPGRAERREERRDRIRDRRDRRQDRRDRIRDRRDRRQDRRQDRRDRIRDRRDRRQDRRDRIRDRRDRRQDRHQLRQDRRQDRRDRRRDSRRDRGNR